MEFITIYRFLGAESGLKTIEGNSLRIGRLKELNDPFEWLPAIVNQSGTNEEKEFNEWCLERYTNQLHDKYGLLCFTEKMSDPLFWSHYADSHRGMALQVDYFLDGSLEKVIYKEERPTFDRSLLQNSERKHEILEAIKDSIIHKSPSWSYESEWRLFIELAKCYTSQGMYFTKIKSDFLKKVILGIRCPYSVQYIRKALDSAGHEDVEVVRAERDQLSYKIKC
ncbi:MULTISPECIES: DUF2971 domain-containing protein [unclassified Lentimonas]|uniref:DUF2971 domain-containing protein n=1 Tax=unclassified Lentimonas TaxID=2630993 RepID=UPI001323B677|nr:MULTISPECIES: DUF2971 domain-containing protein [unclassified Lentimonas]CAA6678478.1 Unannotated [Lentimonas sp. CC4]CAA6687473.1 Unannotated [Lentimonas sp. CC6]CAA7078209.1 Unannotated [Lentimonas sp. CC4]CAA7171190.1 Unannotated [Lentimonas sp. CC21]CAA7183524.1 Unannotated [Lentimonas sp. CC8]